VIDEGTVLKNGNTSTVALVKVGDRSLVVKRYNLKSVWHALKRCVRPSRASISWRNAHRLMSLGIKTPKPIAFVERRFGPLRTEAFFITEYVDGINAYELFHAEVAKEISRTDLIKQFGRLFQMLADASISHGDAKATNFIITKDALSLVDLDAVREHRFRKRFMRAFRRDLNRFMQNWEDLQELKSKFREEFDNLEL
jgi:tRNA A-37 threonylcarbamoyl transferase component Bud32